MDTCHVKEKIVAVQRFRVQGSAFRVIVRLRINWEGFS
jgi:hypothetical protein